MNELVTIKNVRGYINEDNTAYLNLEDVARGLGFEREKNGKMYVRWDRVTEYLKDLSFPTCGENDFIPENIFYKLCMKANNETARKFQDLVCDEILPSIRKHGLYATDVTIEGMIANPDFAITLLTKLKEERKEKQKLQATIKEQAPKVEYHDKVLDTESCYTTTQIAKELGMSAKKLNAILFDMKIQFQQSGQWLLYSKYQDRDYVKTRTHVTRNHDGDNITKHSTVWTEKGRKWIIELLTKEMM